MRASNTQIAQLIGGAVGAVRKEARELMAELQVRIAALEARSISTKSLADFYKGAHLLNADYSRGDLVTRSGAVYLALADTTDVPGNSPHWKMIAKGGS